MEHCSCNCFMDNLKEELTTKGAKCNLQFTAKEREFFEKECGFTDEELVVFQLRNRGWSVIRISFEMQEKFGKLNPGGTYSVSTVEARIRSIKKKILKVI